MPPILLVYSETRIFCVLFHSHFSPILKFSYFWFLKFFQFQSCLGFMNFCLRPFFVCHLILLTFPGLCLQFFLMSLIYTTHFKNDLCNNWNLIHESDCVIFLLHGSLWPTDWNAYDSIYKFCLILYIAPEDHLVFCVFHVKLVLHTLFLSVCNTFFPTLSHNSSCSLCTCLK